MTKICGNEPEKLTDTERDYQFIISKIIDTDLYGEKVTKDNIHQLIVAAFYYGVDYGD